MTADEDEIGRPHMGREQRHLGLRAGRHLVGECVDLQEAIGLRKRRDRARPLARGISDQASGTLDQRHHHEFGAAEFRRNPHRDLCGDLGLRSRRQAGHPSQHRHDHVMEGEHRGSRKTWQDDHGLAVADRKTQRLARLQRHAMGDDAGFSQPRDDAVGDVARALRGAAGKHQHVALRERRAHRGFEQHLIVRGRAKKGGLAAIFVDRGRDDRAVGVVDRGRAKRLTRLNQFVSRRNHGNARLARDRDFRDAAGRAHADLARADHRAGAQQRLAARDVGAGIGYELSGRGGAADFDRARACGLGVLDHDDGVGAPRQRPPSRNRGRRSRQHWPRRRNAAGDDFIVEHQAHRRCFGGASKIGGAHRKAVDIGAVERRHVDRRHDVFGQRAAERVRQPALLARHGKRKQRGFEARKRVLARQDGQELILIDAVAALRLLVLAHLAAHWRNI